MSRKASPKLIGGFVLGAIALAIITVVVFGGGRFFQKTRPFVMYFSESVAGLSVGAPIIMKGVTIGTVTDIDLEFDVPDQRILIPVYGVFVPRTVNFVGADSRAQKEWAEDELAKGTLGITLIKRGMRAQLGMPSIITGKLVVNMVFQPGAPFKLVNAGADFKTPDGLFEVPTIPSQLQEVKALVERLISKLAKLPLEKMVDDLDRAISGFNTLVNNPELEKIIQRTNRTVADIRKLVNNVDAQVEPLSRRADETLKSMRDAGEEGRMMLSNARTTLAKTDAALDRAKTFLTTANTVIKPGSALHYELVKTLQDVGAAARSIRSLSDSLERNPDSILFGRSPR